MGPRSITLRRTIDRAASGCWKWPCPASCTTTGGVRRAQVTAARIGRGARQRGALPAAGRCADQSPVPREDQRA